MQTRDLLFEIGTEELPSGPLNSAITQLEKLVPNALSKASIAFGDVAIYATPRRLAICVHDVGERQPDRVDEYKGPAAAMAYKDGAPTPALIGFAKGKGLTPEQVEVRDVDGTEYIYAVVATEGGDAAPVLTEVLSSLIVNIDWKRSQRWGAGNERFVRPVRWLLALFGREVLPVTFGSITAGNLTYGHRFLSPGAVEIESMREYAKILKGNHVVVDQNERRASIVDMINESAKQFGTALIAEDVLAEVVNLVEYPNPVVCTFDEEFLRVPREILEYAMSKHQRYFAIQRSDGTLDNHFVVISNGDSAHNAMIGEGHQRVVRARLSDAAFFYDEDLKNPLEWWLRKLGTVVFQEKLGTSLAKVGRVEALTNLIAEMIGADETVAASAARAAHLAKADLVTNAVVEFTNLQGVMGSYYALAHGEPDAVAIAIKEHYQPRFAGDAIPSTIEGQIVSVADKLDTIAGIFATGMIPKGTSDPFALRRSAIGILQIAIHALPLTLDEICAAAVAQLEGVGTLTFNPNVLTTQIREFFDGRLQTILRDAGFSYDTVDAVLAVSGNSPADAYARCEALEQFKSSDDMVNLSIGFGRAKNLASADAGMKVEIDLLGAHERKLMTAVEVVDAKQEMLIKNRNYTVLLSEYAHLREPLDAFFENVMVMAGDDALRVNRLALLNRFVSTLEAFADFSKLV